MEQFWPFSERPRCLIGSWDWGDSFSGGYCCCFWDLNRSKKSTRKLLPESLFLLGGSKYQIAGPTGEFVPIFFGGVIQFGYENLFIAGFMAGIIFILLGVFKLGSLSNSSPAYYNWVYCQHGI
ncbi:SulP family inorganic anion transporter [Metabacillus arenae]|uniref:SulP family inorganic anion transporter n=1 Tax=Metabacillus arenae TaxID=2771434 RepID=UPI001CD05FB5|nr:SulP family inorganic anion transporter [Metabacillus arenae]